MGRFNALMEQTYRKVFNLAYRLAGNRSDAEDLTQEAYFRAYRSFHDFEGDRPFENWIYRIVTRLFLDLVRARKRRVKAVSFDAPLHGAGTDDSIYFDVADQAPTADQRLMQRTLGEAMHSVMEALSPDQRLLITLADIEGMPYAEIAAMLDKPVGTIRSRLHRTHKRMRKLLEEGQAGPVARRRELRPGLAQ